MSRKFDLFIDNEWIAPEGGKYIETYNPANGEKLGEVASASGAQVDAACFAARRAFQNGWGETDAHERAAVLRRVADGMRKREKELAETEAQDSGKPISETTGFDIPFSIYAFEYFASICTEVAGETLPVKNGLKRGLFDFTTYEPYGVTAVISPFNYPLHLMTRSLCPALAAGNTAVCKAASATPLSAALLAEIIADAGVPKGVVNFIFGAGATCGEALASNREVDVIAFTGSEEVGRRLMELSARSPVIKKTLLELGGKGPVIIEPDCDMDSAVQCLLLGLCSNQGEVCCATTRMFLHEAIYDEFLEKLKTAVCALKMGDTMDPATEMGSLISAAHLERVDGFVQRAVAEGARLVCGGRKYTQGACAKGNFYLPTILDNLTPNFECVRQEIFGPVLSVQKYHSIDEAVKLANDTDFGLGANIFTNDYRTAYFAAQKINAGTVWVNMPNGSQMNCPFGGNKNSGLGREYGMTGLKEYLRVKNNMWNMRKGTFSYYD